MSLSNKSILEVLRGIVGYNGGKYISGTSEVTVKAIGFEAWTDTVIASIKDADGTEQLTNLGWNSKTIPAGFTAWFGIETSKITLTSGTGQALKSE